MIRLFCAITKKGGKNGANTAPEIMSKVHLLYDLWVPEPDPLETVTLWQQWLHEAAVAAEATILHEQFHQFEPVGITGFLLLAESHISVHTWPEERYAAVDVFTCGRMDAQRVIDYLRQQLQPCEEKLTICKRGHEPVKMIS